MESQLTASNLSRCQDLADRIRKLAYFRIIENLLSADLLLILMDIERDCRTNIQIKSSKMISNQIKTNQIKLLPTWRAVGPNVRGPLRHLLTLFCAPQKSSKLRVYVRKRGDCTQCTIRYVYCSLFSLLAAASMRLPGPILLLDSFYH